MNKLILIGNGFDLAHGLETSYNDFILWYIKYCYVEAFEKSSYKDDIIEIERNFDYCGNLVDLDGVIDFVEESYKQGFGTLGMNIPIMGNDYSKHFPFLTKPSELMRILLWNCSYTTWVDIETEFYEQLKSILRSDDSYSDKQLGLAKLNKSLAFIIDKLGEYLKQLPNPTYDERYMPIFEPRLWKFDLLLPWSAGPQWRSEDRYKINRTCILNFNYTQTCGLYLNHPDYDSPFEIINIHGQLNDKDNPLVFGFGDELDEDYLKMERERAKGYFEFIKSFWYFRTPNYWDLIRFIESDAYHLCVLGHSCGLSDRTMLHMIMEHSNCKSIKIFYHDEETNNNYTTTTYEIARHFNDKALMRKRIVPFGQCKRMPQYDDKRKTPDYTLLNNGYYNNHKLDASVPRDTKVD